MAKGTLPKIDRNKRILEYRKQGMTFVNIARKLNISQPRAWEIHEREAKKLEVEKEKV